MQVKPDSKVNAAALLVVGTAKVTFALAAVLERGI